MRTYNPRKWFEILFQFHKSDTLRRLSLVIVLMAVYTWAVAYVGLNYIDPSEVPFIANIHQMHNLLGFALSLLLVFRTNTAYDRWWEGRKIWGALVNTSRNMALKMNSLLDRDDEDNRAFFRDAIPTYASVLKDHLQSEYTRYTLDDIDHPELKQIDGNKHAPNQVASMMSDRLILLQKQGKLTGEQLLFVNDNLNAFTDICGKCERIKNTPIPYSYTAFIKKFIFIYIMTLPLGYVYSLQYLVVPVVAVVFYVMASLELIAEEIEDPFGHDDNDLPMGKLATNIRKHVNEIL
ncbi:MAG: hypothetical protein H6550_08655 [Chitinophagales bacterium]|nr:hypothetical protein [Chitinophagales bacterium]